MNAIIIEHNYNKVREILKEEYFHKKLIMLDAEVEAFHKQSNPLKDKRFWILKTAVLLYKQKDVENILLSNGYDQKDIKFIKKVLDSTKSSGAETGLGKMLCDAVYSN